MTKYIVEARDGDNPRIMLRQPNGTYQAITHGNGEKSLDDVIALVERANRAAEVEQA